MGPGPQLFLKIAPGPKKISNGPLRGQPLICRSFPTQSCLFDFALLSFHHWRGEEGREGPGKGAEVQELRWKARHACAGDPSGQERLSGLEDLGLCLFKGGLLHGASHKKAER